MFDISLEDGSRIPTMLMVMAAAILLTGAFYFVTFRMLRVWQWPILLLLRSVAIVLVVLLLFRPIVTFHKEFEEKPNLIFLVDRSRSMSIADDASGVNRFNLARQQVEKWWERLKGDFHLHLIEFSDNPRTLENVEQLAASVPDGPTTSIAGALRESKKCAPGKRVDVILLSDGIQNAGDNPNEAAAKLGCVVYTVGVGASLRSNTSHRDIQVTGIDCPEKLLVNNKARISAGIEGINLGGHVCKVILEDNDQPIADQELTLDDIPGAQKVEFEILPTVKGRHKYTVRVPPAATEKITENNQRATFAMVIEAGIRVLYLEGTLRAEYGTLVQRFLSKDPDLEFCALIQTRRNVFQQRTNIPKFVLNSLPTKPEEISKFDVFIFGDIDSTYIKPEQQELIVNRVKEGGGLIMLGGYHSLGPGGYEGSPIGGILPVRLGSREVGQMPDAFVPTLTPEGVVHPIFSNVLGYFPTRQAPAKIAGLPPLDGCTRVESLRPGATLLAGHVTEAGLLPVLAIQPVAKGRTAIFAADTTWKWQQVAQAMGQDTPFLRFWGQMVRWAAGRSSDVKNEASLIGAADKGLYDPGQKVTLSAVVRDQKGEGTSKAKLEAKITGPAGRPDSVSLEITPGADGNYSGTYEPTVPGKFTVVIEAKLDELTLKSEPIAFEVGRPNLEFEKLDLDEETLKGIAARAHGSYAHISTADHLVDKLDKSVRKGQEAFNRQLYSPPWFWAVFVGAVSIEWFLRKKFQLR